MTLTPMYVYLLGAAVCLSPSAMIGQAGSSSMPTQNSTGN